MAKIRHIDFFTETDSKPNSYTILEIDIFIHIHPVIDIQLNNYYTL